MFYSKPVMFTYFIYSRHVKKTAKQINQQNAFSATTAGQVMIAIQAIRTYSTIYHVQEQPCLRLFITNNVFAPAIPEAEQTLFICKIGRILT